MKVRINTHSGMGMENLSACAGSNKVQHARVREQPSYHRPGYMVKVACCRVCRRWVPYREEGER